MISSNTVLISNVLHISQLFYGSISSFEHIYENPSIRKTLTQLPVGTNYFTSINALFDFGQISALINFPHTCQCIKPVLNAHYQKKCGLYTRHPSGTCALICLCIWNIVPIQAYQQYRIELCVTPFVTCPQSYSLSALYNAFLFIVKNYCLECAL